MSSSSPDPSKSPDHLLPVNENNELIHPNQKCQCNERLRDTIETPKTDLSHPHCSSKAIHHHHSTQTLTAPQHSHQINQLNQINQISCSVHTIQNIQASPNTGCSCHFQEESHQKDEVDVRELRKFESDDRIEISPLPPALPPRPPPRPRFDSSLNSRYRTRIGEFK